MRTIDLVSRRGFLGGMFSAGALVLATKLGAATDADHSAWHPGVYLGIETDGTVIVVAHRSEMGTGIRTSLPMVVADELDADWKRVRIEQAIGDEKFGSQDTDGSQSIREFYDAMREAGATARLMLERAAAAKWSVPAAECRARNHRVTHSKTGKELGYGELAALAAKQSVPKKEELRFKQPGEFRYIGKGVPITDLDDLCSGHGTFGIDARMPGMVYASIERSPVIGGQLKSHDDKEARKVRGVQETVVIPAFKPPASNGPGRVSFDMSNRNIAVMTRMRLT